MDHTAEQATSTESPRDRNLMLLAVATAIAGILVILILAQATLAGQFLFNGGEIDVHGYLGNGSFLLGLVAAALVIFGRGPIWLVVAAVALLAALFAQIGLGYAGRESAAAASMHIPVGVTSLGLAVAVVILGAGARRPDRSGVRA